MENVALTYKSMSGWVYGWPFANSWGMGHAKSDSHWLLHRRKAKHNLPFGLHAILFFRGMCYICPGHRGCLWGKTAKWLWSQCPWNTTVPIHYPEAVCTGICNQVIGDWKSAGNSSRGSLIRGPSIQRTYVDMTGGEQMEGQYIPQGRDKSRRIREALAFSHRDWVWRSSSRVGTGVSGWGFGQIRQTDRGRC